MTSWELSHGTQLTTIMTAVSTDTFM